MKFRSFLILLPLLFCAGHTAAQDGDDASAKTEEDTRTLEAIVVRGDQSGPSIWKFSRGNKVVWVLGTFQPLPKNTTFNPTQIEKRISESEIVLGPQGLVVGDNIGIFKGLTLWPSIRRNKFNADGKSLKDVLPPATYARWIQLKLKYLGNDRGVERLRPMYAASELFEAALEKTNLETANLVSPVVANASKASNVPVVDTRLRLAIHGARDAAKEFGVSATDDIRCLEQTLDRLDSYLQVTSSLGNSWAIGDLPRLLNEPSSKVSVSTCWGRLTNEAIGKQQGISDLYKQVDAKWVKDFRDLLQKHDVIFTTLPVRDLMDSKGLVAVIKSEGFQVEAPAAADPIGATQ